MKKRNDYDKLHDFARSCSAHPGYLGTGRPANCERCRSLLHQGRNLRAIVTKGCAEHRYHGGQGRNRHCERCNWVRAVERTLAGHRIGRS